MLVTGLLLGGAALSAYSQYRGGQAAAQVARNNAQLAEWQKADALRQGVEQASAIRARGSQVAGQQRAITAANGVETDAMFDTTYVATELDATTARNNAARQAWGFASEAQDQRAQAKIASDQGILGAAGTSLMGFGQAAAAYKP